MKEKEKILEKAKAIRNTKQATFPLVKHKKVKIDYSDPHTKFLLTLIKSFYK